ncbi:D-xylose 1-dehydrogenase Gfo6 [Halocatena pleomorpha]|uniref:Gfo/Idh/MocA family oxidoreductase n=1 Tax=Halocatena pleomorpha TaxID=1785090 RepID=A0A3P3RA39_9EURY|nr:D-xylose 1-dehydrogenase Gfo6 [Halocatena pleomorpha]RRJ29550.1 gfo/Idh/MocA family oxidoreductase [Halocatena pleomorpha]
MDLNRYFGEFTSRDWQTSDVATVRIAVIGLGEFARERALPAIRDAQFCEATVLVSGSPQKAADLSSTLAIDRVIDYEAYHAGEAAEAYDAVYIATPPAFHLEYAETAAQLGKDILCEKPLAATFKGAERMVDVSTDVVLMTAYRLRTEPAIRRMREAIRDGVIGKPVQIHSGFSTQILEYTDPESWRLDPDIAGGGALMDLGVYPLNTSRFLLDADPVAVSAETTSSGPPFDLVDEHAAVQLTFPEGETASCTASFNAHPDSRLHVLGTDGQLLLRFPFGGDVSQEIIIERGETHAHYTGPPVDEVCEEFDYFAHCIHTEIECECDGEEGRTDLRIIEAAYTAAETSTQVSL